MTHPNLPVLELVLVNYKNFNARATRDACAAAATPFRRTGT
jgi:hypothetical protein